MSDIKSRLANMSPDKRRVTLDILPQKLAKSANSERLSRLLTDFCFLGVKIDVLGVQPLIEDYNLAITDGILLSQEKNESLKVIQNALRLSEEAINEDKSQLGEQLLGRLMSCELTTIASFLNQINKEKQLSKTPWLRHITPTLTQSQGSLLRTLRRHTNSVSALAITPDNRSIVSGSWDSLIKVWNIDTGEELKTLKGHTSIVYAVAVTPDGQSIVSASTDKTLRVWDLETGKELRRFEFGVVNALILTPDGKRIVTAMEDKSIKIWDYYTGHLIKTLKGHTNSVDVLAISLDGKILVSMEGSSKLGMISKFLSPEIPIVRKLETSGSDVRGCAFSSYANSDVSIILNVDVAPHPEIEKSVIKVWDFEIGFELQTLYTQDSSPASALAISPDKQTIIAECGHLLKTWIVGRKGNLLKAKSSHYLKGHTRSIHAVAITPDSKYAVSASHDFTLKVWDLASGDCLKTLIGHTGPVQTLIITSDGKRVISASDDHSLKFWDLYGPENQDTIPRHNHKITDIKIFKNGKEAITSSWDNNVCIWNVSNGEKIKTIGKFGTFLDKKSAATLLKKLYSKTENEIRSTNDFCVNLGVSRLINSGFSNDQIGSWNPPIYDLIVMPEEQGIICALDGGLMAFDMTVGASISRILYLGEPLLNPVYSCAISPDGSTILFGISSRSQLNEHEWAAIKTISSPETLLKKGVKRTQLRAWDINTGEIRTFGNHAATINAVAVTSDGILAAGRGT